MTSMLPNIFCERVVLLFEPFQITFGKDAVDAAPVSRPLTKAAYSATNSGA